MADRSAASPGRRLRAACLVLALCGLAGLAPSPLTGGRPDLDVAFPDSGGNGSPEERTEAWDVADESEIPAGVTLSGPRPALPFLLIADVTPLAGTDRRPIRPPA